MELEEADCTSSGVAHNSADRQGVSQEQLHSSANNRDGPAELTTGGGAKLATGRGTGLTTEMGVALTNLSSEHHRDATMGFENAIGTCLRR